jgi:hypothetical protein
MAPDISRWLGYVENGTPFQVTNAGVVKRRSLTFRTHVEVYLRGLITKTLRAACSSEP